MRSEDTVRSSPVPMVLQVSSPPPCSRRAPTWAALGASPPKPPHTTGASVSQPGCKGPVLALALRSEHKSSLAKQADCF